MSSSRSRFWTSGKRRDKVVFSSRLPSSLTTNRLTATLERLRMDGRRVRDLTVSNPTQVGLEYPQDLLSPLADGRGLVYQPHPFGLELARAAVSVDYARRGLSVAHDRIVLTSSTSEAYSLLFKTLCDPGDEVLVPQPSYPLFEQLTRLDAIVAVPYELEYHGKWQIDIDGFRRSLTPRSKVAVVVSPNNPTGSYARSSELSEIERLSAANGLAVIVDEVFADYELEPGAASRAGRALECGEALTCSLGGLSKSIGLPQAKLAWIAFAGPECVVADALVRLEYVADAYLSVSTPVQAAAADLMTAGATVREAIAERITSNLATLRNAVARVPACRLLDAEGGWSAVLQVPTLSTEEDLVLDLLIRDGILVHPGYFFDFPRGSFLVLSLLTPCALLAEGVSDILARFASSAPLSAAITPPVLPASSSQPASALPALPASAAPARVDKSDTP
jgi:alanine-synthesizing transaminase